jgi:signal transduction histidine kinase
VTPLKRGYGTITGQLITFNDVTERKHREQRLKQQRQRLEVINRVLRHDIRNDMNVILGSAEVLPDTPEVEAHAQKIMRKSEEIVELSEKVRQIEVLNRQKSTHKEVIDIVEIVEQTVADLEQTYPSAEFHCDLPDQADAYTIGLISASINNVIENAVEHNDRSTPEIEVSVTEATDEAKHIAIAVSDNGPGLPDREREVIEAGTESPLNHSNGLGLWITSWIVTRSGGTITFSENSPRGSTITIRLPSVASKTDLS